ncbi:MAG: hypothetical protein NVSMB51_05020 [Solirubrobacteraceae bacterium]
MASSQEDEGIYVARVRNGFDAFSRGDASFVEEWLAPDCRWEENNAGGFPGLDPVYVGPDGFRKWVNDMGSTWDLIESVAEDVIEVPGADGPSFVCQTRLFGRGRQGIEVGWLLFNVLWTHAGEAVTLRRVSFDLEEALAWAARPSSDFETTPPASD